MSRNMSLRHRRAVQRRNARELEKQIIVTLLGIALVVTLLAALV
jgi:hypothetical protein